MGERRITTRVFEGAVRCVGAGAGDILYRSAVSQQRNDMAPLSRSGQSF